MEACHIRQPGAPPQRGRPATSGTRPQSSTPAEWATDSCFSYFNPVTTKSLDRWLNAWDQALLTACERLVTDRELHLI